VRSRDALVRAQTRALAASREWPVRAALVSRRVPVPAASNGSRGMPPPDANVEIVRPYVAELRALLMP